jgi:hypothetical protein
MKTNEVIKQIKTILGLEVKLAQMMLVDGVTVLEADAFEAGKEVFIVTPDGNVPLPVGDYELENGQILVVAEEGIIAEIKEMPSEAEEEVEAPEAEAPAPVEEAEMTQAQPKKTIESIIKETLFSEVEKIKAENESLKAELSALKLEFNSEPAVKPISYNPENEVKKDIVKISANKGISAVDRVLTKMY